MEFNNFPAVWLSTGREVKIRKTKGLDSLGTELYRWAGYHGTITSVCGIVLGLRLAATQSSQIDQLSTLIHTHTDTTYTVCRRANGATAEGRTKKSLKRKWINYGSKKKQKTIISVWSPVCFQNFLWSGEIGQWGGNREKRNKRIA